MQEEVSDEKIDKALNQWPKAIKDIDAKAIRNKIISRRSKIELFAINFKRIIDEEGLYNNWPLKGCENIEIDDDLKHCFDCKLQ